MANIATVHLTDKTAASHIILHYSKNLPTQFMPVSDAKVKAAVGVDAQSENFSVVELRAIPVERPI